MKPGTEVGLDLCQIVLNRDPAPLPQRGTAPFHQKIFIFGYVCFGQTAGWIKMQLGTEVDLSPSHSVRWGPSYPSPKWAQPQFSAHACCGKTAGWIKMPLRREVGLSPGHIVLDGDHPSPSPKGAQPPNFRPMSIVAKRSPISATA